MKVVVTGATGGLGRVACSSLLDRAVSVVGFGRDVAKVTDLIDRGLRFTCADLTRASPSLFAEAMAGADAVWHCAALSAPWGPKEDFYSTNVLLTRQLLSAALQARVPVFVHVSTPAVYFDYRDRFGVREDFVARRPVNEYAHTKFLAEQEVRQAVGDTARGLMRAVILRPRALFGPTDQVLLPRLLEVARGRGGRLPVPKEGRTTLDLTYIDNVVDAMWLSTQAKGLGPVEVFNITNGEPTVLRELLEQLSSGLGGAFELQSVPYAALALAARVMLAKSALTGREPALTPYSVGALAYSMTLDISRARALLGYEPRISMQEGLRRTTQALMQRQP